MKLTILGAALVIGLLLAGVGDAQAALKELTGLELAQESDVVLRGRVTETGEASATVEVLEVIWGQMEAKSVKVTPVTVPVDVGPIIMEPAFKQGEEVLVMGKLGKANDLTLAATGYGKMSLDDKTRAWIVAAAKRFMEIAAIKDEHQKNRAMLGEINSRNVWLQRSAETFVRQLTYTEKAALYEDLFTEMLADENWRIRRAGLTGLRQAKSEKALPKIIELSRDGTPMDKAAAAAALRAYGTDDTVRALIAMTRDADPWVREAACLGLQDAKGDEVKRAVVPLLQDKEERVRPAAVEGLTGVLREGKAGDLVPKLAHLLFSQDEKLRVATAKALGETTNPKATQALVRLLAEQDAKDDLQLAMIQSLHLHYSKGAKEARALIDGEIGNVIQIMKSGSVPSHRKDDPAYAALALVELSDAPAAKEALKWADKKGMVQESRRRATKP